MNWCASQAFSRQELSIQRAFLPFQPFEALLKETQRLYLEFPPSTLEKDVKERYRRYREQMKPPSKPRPPKKVSETLCNVNKASQLELSFVLQGSFFQRDWHRGHSARRGGSGRRHRRVSLAERELYAGGSSNGVSPKLHFSAVPTLRLNFQQTTWLPVTTKIFSQLVTVNHYNFLNMVTINQLFGYRQPIIGYR